MTETLTIRSIGEVRPWKTDNGDFRSIRVVLEDNRTGEITTKAETLDKRMAEVQAAVGKPTEFETEPGKFVDLKMKFPQKDGRGSGSKWQPKSIEERNEIIAQSSLNAAVAVVTALTRDENGVPQVIIPWAVDAVQEAQRMFFANTIRLARNSEVGTNPPGMGTTPKPTSEHRSGTGRAGSVAGDSDTGLREALRPEAEPPVPEHRSGEVADSVLGKGGQPAASSDQPTPPDPGAAGEPESGAGGVVTTDSGEPLATFQQQRKVHALAGELGMDHDQLKARLKDPERSLATYTFGEMERLIGKLSEMVSEQRAREAMGDA